MLRARPIHLPRCISLDSSARVKLALLKWIHAFLIIDLHLSSIHFLVYIHFVDDNPYLKEYSVKHGWDDEL